MAHTANEASTAGAASGWQSSSRFDGIIMED